MDSRTTNLHTFKIGDLHKAIDEVAGKTKGRRIIVVGSQAILGSIPPNETRPVSPRIHRSNDIDLYLEPALPPEEQTNLQFLLGPDSEFSLENSWEIEPVGNWVMMTSLPEWEERLVEITTPAGNMAECISTLDIAFNKAEAGRPKDIEYLAALFRSKLLLPSQIKEACERYEDKLYTGQVDKVKASVQAAILMNNPPNPPGGSDMKI